MCTGLEIAALATAVGGTGASIAGQAQASSDRAKAMAGQTDLSAKEFDDRTKLANDIFKQNSDISQSTFDQLASLDDQEFQQRTGLSKDEFSQLSAIQQKQVTDDAAAATADTDAIAAARQGRDKTQADARAEYNQTLADANTKQDDFRKQGDTVASQLVDAFTPGAMAARGTDAAAARDALVASTVAKAAPGSQITVSPELQAVFDRYSAGGKAKALAGSAAASKVASYGDALAGGDRAINNGNLNTAFITDASRRALAPLGAQLGVSSLKYNDAASAAQDRAAAADATLAGALGLHQTEASGNSNKVTSYTGAMDSALDKYFGTTTGNVGSHGDALIGANNTQLAGTNSASSNFENNINNVTNYRMANANGGTLATLGQIASSIAPSLFSIAGNQKFAKAANNTSPNVKA